MLLQRVAILREIQDALVLFLASCPCKSHIMSTLDYPAISVIPRGPGTWLKPCFKGAGLFHQTPPSPTGKKKLANPRPPPPPPPRGLMATSCPKHLQQPTCLQTYIEGVQGVELKGLGLGAGWGTESKLGFRGRLGQSFQG